ncbi:hypothetical protein N7456_008363 [Penicillium angulare]|uniref:Major facilitator superfamily (MFS) profile domain-containing protein n=1 Tax=Penicillium angulare TaxID=116970 RepID=A0A9W9FCW9_9EURO|nr:hypothetical protein N7456_008363 [Penicillium angulare]
MTSDHGEKPWLFDFRSSERFLIVTVTIAIFTDSFIYGMIVPIIPIALVDRAGERPEDAQYLVSVLLAVYGATLLVGSPLFGYFADQSKLRRVPFILGLIALGTSTALFTFARTFPALVVARALQGLSAAAVWVVGLAIVADSVPSERVGAAMGQTTIGLTWGFVLGPMAGGYIYEHLGWYGTFTVPGLLVVVDIALRLLMIEAPKNTQPDKTEPYLYSENSPSGFNSYDTFNDEGILAPALSSSSSSRNHDNESAPLLQSSASAENDHDPDNKVQRATIFSLLLSARMPFALLATLTMATIFASLESTLPLFTMQTFNWGSTGAGLIFLAVSVPTFFGVYIGEAMDRIGVRILGSTAFAAGSICWILMRFVTSNSTEHIVLLVILLFCLGLAFATIEIASMTEVAGIIDDYETEHPGAFGGKSPIAQGYAMFNMAFAGGQLVGPLIAAALRVHAGWSAMTLVLGVICGVVAIPVGLFIGPRPVVEMDEASACESA